MPFTQTVSPFNAPNYDVFSPARRQDPRGVVLGAPLDGAQSYVPWIGLSTVRELALQHADKVGLVPVEDFELARERRADSEELLAQATARVAELEAEIELHTRWVKQKLGLDKPPKPMGRPPREDK
jgi:hypothetical protein